MNQQKPDLHIHWPPLRPTPEDPDGDGLVLPSLFEQYRHEWQTAQDAQRLQRGQRLMYEHPDSADAIREQLYFGED